MTYAGMDNVAVICVSWRTAVSQKFVITNITPHLHEQDQTSIIPFSLLDTSPVRAREVTKAYFSCVILA